MSPALGLNPEIFDNETTNIENEDFSERPSKRQKTQRSKNADANLKVTKNVRGKRGKLAKMTDVPIEILMEVFVHLHPLDLLHLSWTSKAVWSVVMNKKCAFIWRQVLANIEGLPECPLDLTEPQYTRLAFDSHCHYCFAPSVTTIQWFFRVRCCSKCWHQEFTPSPYLTFQGFSYEESHSLCRTIASCTQRRRGRSGYRSYVSRGELDRLHNAVSSILGDSMKMRELLEERTIAAGRIQEHATRCENWHSKMLESRSEELNDARTRRKEAIFGRLEALGWEEEIQYLEKYNPGCLGRHALVRQPKELTERIWNNIKDRLIELLENKKEVRLKKEHFQRRINRAAIVSKLLANYRLKRPRDEAIPATADVCSFKEFSTVIDSPEVKQMCEDDFSTAMESLPRLSEEWRSTVTQKLLSVLPVDTDVGADVNLNARLTVHLDLATTFFCCKGDDYGSCDEPISYPRILRHRCMTDPGYAFSEDEEDINYYNRQIKRQPWNQKNDRLAFDGVASACARTLVELCGLDPMVTTNQDMDRLDARFSCTICQKDNVHFTMAWRRMVAHSKRDHRGIGRITVLAEKERPRIELAENEAKAQPSRWGYTCHWCCSKCREVMNYHSLKSHMRKEHDIDDMQDKDCYAHPDCPVNISPPFAVKIQIDTKEE